MTSSHVNVSNRNLAVYRLIIAFSTFVYFVTVFSINGWEYFDYLTNWGHTLMAICFGLLTVGHIFTGHLLCKPQQQRTVSWKICVFVYNLTVTLVYMITFCYWFLVFPFMEFGPEWTPPTEPECVPDCEQPEEPKLFVTILTYFALTISHTVPFVTVNVDMYLGSIAFYPRHLVPILVCGVLYLAYHLL